MGSPEIGIAHFLNCKLRLIGSYFALMLICVACSNGHFYLFNEGNLTTEAIHAVMSEEKPNQKEKIVLRGDRVRQLRQMIRNEFDVINKTQE